MKLLIIFVKLDWITFVKFDLINIVKFCNNFNTILPDAYSLYRNIPVNHANELMKETIFEYNIYFQMQTSF